MFYNGTKFKIANIMMDIYYYKSKEENKSRDALSLGMARMMLLDNYNNCVAKGYYDLTEREVYHALYESYIQQNGNGIIKELAKKIVKLPTEPSQKGHFDIDV